jgi:hypothetical protein
VAPQIMWKQVVGIDNGPGKRALPRQVQRGLRSQRSASHQDRATAVGRCMSRHRGGKFAVECEVNLGGFDLDFAGRGRALGNGPDKHVVGAGDTGRL